MNLMIQFIIAAAIGYLFGCSNLAYYVAAVKGVDLRKKGSGNLGASNALIALGKGWGVVVGAHDIGKAVVAILLTRAFFPETGIYGMALSGMMTVMGHMYPFWLRFKGGKGFASFMGCLLGLNWKLFIIVGIAVIVITVVTDYIVFATTTAVITGPVYLLIFENWIAAAILAAATVCILWKHRENFVRLYHKEEIGLRRAMSGKEK